MTRKAQHKKDATPDGAGEAERPSEEYESLYRSYVSLLKQVDHLSTLREIGLAINSSIELSETLPVIANVVQGALDVGRLIVYELEEGGDSANPVIAKYGRDLIARERLEGEEMALPHTPLADALATRQVVLINSDFQHTAYVPLFAKNVPVGIMRLDDKGDGTDFTQEDVQLFQTVGSQIAVAINNAQLYSLAVTDGLTRLYVRRYFDLRMEEEFDQARRYGRVFSLMMLDIDHFKNFNDTHGHQMGDAVLQQCASIIMDETRKSDVCCRYGGEEMAVILPETTLSDGAILGNKLCEQMRAFAFGVDSEEALRVTTSIGVIQYSDDFEKWSEMVKGCDEALYKAKELGRNRVEIAGL